ncbi:MAG: hypothetical protein ABIJ09_09495 [Pseudomonadota bacterium]
MSRVRLFGSSLSRLVFTQRDDPKTFGSFSSTGTRMSHDTTILGDGRRVRRLVLITSGPRADFFSLSPVSGCD